MPGVKVMIPWFIEMEERVNVKRGVVTDPWLDVDVLLPEPMLLLPIIPS